MHPPAPGPFVRPNLNVIENAVRDVTFPISKRELIEHIGDEDTIVLGGRNVDMRVIVRDLRDDYFEDEADFRAALEAEYGERVAAGEGVEAMIVPMPPTGFPEDMPHGAPGASDQPALPKDNA